MIPEAVIPVLGRRYISHIVKMPYFYRNVLLSYEAWFRQTKCIVMMSKGMSTLIISFMSPGLGVLVLGRGHIGYTVKMHCLPNIDKCKYIVILNHGSLRVYQICKFHEPLAEVSYARVWPYES